MGEFFSLEYLASFAGIRGVIHIGAHHAEEAAEYAAYTPNVVWFEAHPEYAQVMRHHLATNFKSQAGYEYVLSNEDGKTVDFWITSNEYASSVLEPKEELTKNPHVSVTDKITLVTARFDTVWPTLSRDITAFNTLVLDTQGSELMILEGMGEYVDYFDVIQTEYSTIEMYEGGPRLSDLDEFLQGYTMVFPSGTPEFHADALFVRDELV